MIKKVILSAVFCILGMTFVIGQDTTVVNEPKPLTKAAFESGYCLDNMTVAQNPVNTLEFILQHRFGTIQNDFSDLFGIWGASNIRMGLNYNVHKNVVIGFGTTKNKRYQDLMVKYTFFRQRDGGFPLTIAYLFNVAVNASNKDNFGYEYKFSDRLSYYNELMFARRFCRMFSMQASVSFTHYNQVDTLLKNDVLGVALLGRIKVSPQTSVILSYSWPFVFGYDKPFILKYGQDAFYKSSMTPYGNANIGVEFSTSTHAFHIFLGAAQGIIPQEIYMYNQNNFWNGQIVLGFNMTRLWTF